MHLAICRQLGLFALDVSEEPHITISISNRDDAKHLEYFMNGQWKHSENCKIFTNKECSFKTVKKILE
ncbi:MAG: hypothetical protein WB975_03515 [Nitrososphaeraceae archaeon]